MRQTFDTTRTIKYNTTMNKEDLIKVYNQLFAENQELWGEHRSLGGHGTITRSLKDGGFTMSGIAGRLSTDTNYTGTTVFTDKEKMAEIELKSQERNAQIEADHRKKTDELMRLEKEFHAKRKQQWDEMGMSGTPYGYKTDEEVEASFAKSKAEVAQKIDKNRQDFDLNRSIAILEKDIETLRQENLRLVEANAALRLDKVEKIRRNDDHRPPPPPPSSQVYGGNGPPPPPSAVAVREREYY